MIGCFLGTGRSYPIGLVSLGLCTFVLFCFFFFFFLLVFCFFGFSAGIILGPKLNKFIKKKTKKERAGLGVRFAVTKPFRNLCNSVTGSIPLPETPFRFQYKQYRCIFGLPRICFFLFNFHRAVRIRSQVPLLVLSLDKLYPVWGRSILKPYQSSTTLSRRSVHTHSLNQLMKSCRKESSDFSRHQCYLETNLRTSLSARKVTNGCSKPKKVTVRTVRLDLGLQ